MIKRLIIALALGTGILFTANAQNSAVKDSLLRIYVTAPHDLAAIYSHNRGIPVSAGPGGRCHAVHPGA